MDAIGFEPITCPLVRGCLYAPAVGRAAILKLFLCYFISPQKGGPDPYESHKQVVVAGQSRPMGGVEPQPPLARTAFRVCMLEPLGTDQYHVNSFNRTLPADAASRCR